MVLLLKKIYLYITKDPEAFHYIPGVSNFFQGGVQMLISIEKHIYVLAIFQGGGGLDPYLPMDLHIGNVIITGQYLSQPGF